ncbi:hypothetical protein EDB80DRAFT_532562, partial [Ilyonectria destructans]
GAGEEGYGKMYMSLLEAHGPTPKLMLHHVRDGLEEPFLFHCTPEFQSASKAPFIPFGRDCTGIVALLTPASANLDTIALDRLLKRIGSEPVRKFMLDHVTDAIGCGDFDDLGFHNLCSLRRTAWDAFIN